MNALTHSMIGIIAITVPGSTICQEEMAYYAMKKNDQNNLSHPSFRVDNLDYSIYHELVKQSDWAKLGHLIVSRIEALTQCPDPATVAIIPSNTPHYAIDLIQQLSPIPVLSILDITVNECIQQYYQNVLILGTRQTMHDGLYEKPLLAKGINPILADPDLTDKVDDLIFHIIGGTHTELEIQSVAEMINAIDFDAVILGCTELPYVFTNESINSNLKATLNKPIVDTTRLLARAVVDYTQGANL